MFYVILEKDLETEQTRVHSVFESEDLAVAAMEDLIEATEDFGYRMDCVGG